MLTVAIPTLDRGKILVQTVAQLLRLDPAPAEIILADQTLRHDAAVDTKLARSAKPAHVLQLLFYAEVVERLQGAPVERVHVENGRGERESFRVAELHAQGLSRNGIALELGRSGRTISRIAAEHVPPLTFERTRTAAATAASRVSDASASGRESTGRPIESMNPVSVSPERNTLCRRMVTRRSRLVPGPCTVARASAPASMAAARVRSGAQLMTLASIGS